MANITSGNYVDKNKYEAYISPIETKKMLKERDKHLVFVEHCTREWEGEIKHRGDSVRINGIGSPTVYTLKDDGSYGTTSAYTIAGTDGKLPQAVKNTIHRNIPEWEEVSTYTVNLPVLQEAVWNYGVGDLDQQMMSEKGMVAKLRNKQAKKLADTQDRYVAKVMAGFMQSAYKTTTTGSGESAVTSHTAVKVTASETPASGYVNILDLLDDIVLRLNENNVSDSEQLYCECSPRFWSILKKAYRDLDTDNSGLLAHRKLGRYNDIIIAKTNNAVISEGNEYIFVRTKDAVAFFDPLTKNEAYRPQGGFVDAVKGFSWYDCGIVDSNALCVAKIAYQ
jgi:hypothetical protein